MIEKIESGVRTLRDRHASYTGLHFSTIESGVLVFLTFTMSDTAMDVDSEPQNAMAALMASAKGKGKASNGEENGNGEMSQAELKALNERDGLPWSVLRSP